MIEIKNLTVSYGQKTVFRNNSYSLPDEGLVLLSGESGIGKTTLLFVLAGLLKPQSGSISGLSNRKISFVFQEPRLLEHMRAIDNVALVSSEETAKCLLEKLNLIDVANQRAKELSGGQKQRISLARAFAYSRDIVLLDEPFTGLDEANKARAIDLIRTARLAIVVSHDPDDALLLNPDRKINL